MDRIRNPYTPGAGARPTALVGRDQEIDAFDALIERAALKMRSRGLVLHGLRGVGKTVLLNELHSHAQRAGWLAVKIEAQSDDAGKRDVRYTLARELTIAARAVQARAETVTASLKDALATITSFGIKIGGVGVDLGVAPRAGRADSGDLEVDLRELVQDVAAAMEHAAMQEGRPFYVIGAGLPSVRTVLPEIRSYAERQFEYRTIDRLPAPYAAEALRGPAARYDVHYEDDALTELLGAADGYPFFLQVFGNAAWLTAPGPVQITAEDAKIAVQQGTQDLDDRFFPSRWNRATRAQRRFMRAMAADNDRPSAIGDVAGRLGVTLGGISPARGQLIAKGLIYAPERGLVAFTVPHMAAYISRLAEDD